MTVLSKKFHDIFFRPVNIIDYDGNSKTVHATSVSPADLALRLMGREVWFALAIDALTTSDIC